MKTKVLEIQPKTDKNSLDVLMSIGQDQHRFTFNRTFDTIGDRQLQIITYNAQFGENFKFNQHLVDEVMNLVRQVFNGGVVELPIEVEDFGTPEQAMQLQKPFNLQKSCVTRF